MDKHIFSLSQRNKANDTTPFLEFYLRGLIESLVEIEENVFIHIRILSLRDFYRHEKFTKNLNRRQYELLEFLLSNPRAFNLKDLYEKPGFRILYQNTSERTARRDLKHLLDKKCLTTYENNLYKLNFFLLD
jgi:Fic family protein